MKIQFILILMLCFPLLNFGQESFTLQEAIDYALQNHNSIKNAQLDEMDAKYQIRETAAIGIPQVNAEIGYRYNIQLPVSVLLADDFPFPVMDSSGGGSDLIEFPQGVKNNFYAGVEVTTLAFDWSYIIGLRAAKKLKELRSQQVELTEQEVRANVRESYLGTFLLDLTQETLENNVSNLEQLLFETQQSYEAGFVERLDVLRLELSLSNLKTELKNLIEQKQVVLNVLKFQMNYPLDQELQLEDDVETLLGSALDVNTAEEIDFNLRKEIDLVDTQIRLNEDNVKRIRAGYFPNLFLFAGYQQTLQGNSLFRANQAFWRPNSYAGFQINVPIFDGMEKKNSVARAEITIQKFRNQRKDLFNAIKLEVGNARINYLNRLESMNEMQSTLDIAQAIYNSTQVKYQEGVGSSLEVSQAEQALYQAQSNYNRSLYDVLIAKASLDKALGK
ncbi:MAG: TolC family protein [Bacteroidota bacterium]